ncbi:hypothetical protein OUZ56_008914 [Daphnia magna]|uniref:Uncharacterized protein n=1 Tax=Daphnia magna TaxID=35525 RepID=A0ABR0AEF9_9CRUS|nr:hypothetical protein OUZ56_008914 [Daphnia magna]
MERKKGADSYDERDNTQVVVNRGAYKDGTKHVSKLLFNVYRLFDMTDAESSYSLAHLISQFWIVHYIQTPSPFAPDWCVLFRRALGLGYRKRNAHLVLQHVTEASRKAITINGLFDASNAVNWAAAYRSITLVFSVPSLLRLDQI